MSSTFDLNVGEISRNIKVLNAKLKVAVDVVVDRQGVLGEARMKTRAPWHDDTGAARTGLHTTVSNTQEKHTIVFAHSVHYGIWLEVKNSGKYEVIMPTVLTTGHELMSDFSHLMRRL